MLNKQEQLALAIKIAAAVHADQFDKGGKPYILHPLHLMSQLLFDTQLATIAVLHDVIEDSNGQVTATTLEDLGFSERVLCALELLTHDKEDDYIKVYIRGICANYDALRVKRKDLGHNSDITRLQGVRPKDLERIEKYHRAFILLGAAKRNFEERK